MSLEGRVANEKKAYNTGDVFAASAALQRRFHHVFTCPDSRRLDEYLDSAIRRYCVGREVLNLGCFEGEETVKFRSYGAKRIVGIDISEKAIEIAIARHSQVAEFHVMDGHRMAFGDETFDMVTGRAILHHLEFQTAVREIHRVLRPGGYAIFVEPLGDNPVAKLIRAVTPRARTADERPLSRAQINWVDTYFGGAQHCFGNLLSVPLAMLTSLTPFRSDNLLLRLAAGIDSLVAASPLKTWMRSVVLCWQKIDCSAPALVRPTATEHHARGLK